MRILSEDDLLRIMPSFRYLGSDARQKVMAAMDENERPSDAVNSRGMIEGSDIDDMQATHKSMGNGFELPQNGFATHQDLRSMDPARVSEAPRGGQAFVRRAMGGAAPMSAQSPDDRASGNTLPNGTFTPGNEDPNDAQFGAGGATPADDPRTPGGGPKGRDKSWWIKNYPAPGRGQVLTPVDGALISPDGGVSRPVAGGYGDNNTPVETVSRPLTQAQTTRAARRQFYGR